MLGHQNCGSTETASHVSYTSAGTQFRVDFLERRNPGADQIRGVTRAKKSFRTHEHARVMFVPAHALARLEFLFQFVFGLNGAQRHLKSAGQKCRAIIIGKNEGLLFG